MRGLSKIGSGGILMTASFFQECAMFVCIVMDYYKLGESIVYKINILNLIICFFI